MGAVMSSKAPQGAVAAVGSSGHALPHTVIACSIWLLKS